VKAKGKKITAQHLASLLRLRHHKDVFVDECKNGPTWYANGLLKVDAWAMRKSWANPCAWGYEIKVSRADYVQDDKWPGYLTLCNQFYFVCIPGIIDKAEVPEDAGLIVSSLNGTRLYTKKKAPYREVDIPQDIYQYILMSRAKIIRYEHRQSRADYWKRWLKDKSDNRELGYEVSKAVADHVHTIERQNVRLINEHKAYERLENMLSDMGISPGAWNMESRVQQAIERVNASVPFDMDQTLNNLERAITSFRAELAKNSHATKEPADEKA